MENRTLGELFENKCSIFRERPALYFHRPEGIGELGYDRYRKLTRAAAHGLHRIGLEPGMRAAILGSTSVDRCLAFFAVQLCGAVDVSFDETLAEDKTVYLLKHTECRFCFVEDPERARRLARKTSGVTFVLLGWNKQNGDRTPNLADLTGFKDGRFEDPGKVRWHRERLYDDPASIVFKRVNLRQERPRGIVLTHRNIIANLAGIHAAMPANENDTMILTPPLWHAMGRFGLLFALWNGAGVLLSTDDRFYDDLLHFQPTHALAPPEHFASLYERLIEGDGRDDTMRIILRKFYFYTAALLNWSRRVLSGQRLLFRTSNQVTDPIRMLSALSLAVFTLPLKKLGDMTLGKEIQARLGGRLRVIITGGSPLRFAIDQFFQSLNVAVLEGYWMTEAGHMAACRVLPFTGQRSRRTPRTVGPLLSGLELKLINNRDEDVSHIPGNPGVIFIRGDSIMQGYYREAAFTSEVLDENGWFRTGDRGRLTINGELQLLRRRGLPRDFRIED